MKYFFSLVSLAWFISHAQTTVNVYPDSLLDPVSNSFKPGIFYVPKTIEGVEVFNSTDVHYNSIRLHIVESALNNTTNLADCLAFLESFETDIVNASNRCYKLIFIFEKMPAWMSSSSDGSPAATPGWFVLNTKPPASYTTWNNAVTAITDLLVNTMGIDNAYFEIWNEPDLGSWSASEEEFFELFENTYDAIKAVDTNIPVGGTAVNFWANDIYWQPPIGYISPARADSSLNAKLLDSTMSWGKPLDFLSWHNFNMNIPVIEQAKSFFDQKIIDLGYPEIPFIISEWNAPSQVRESALHHSFMFAFQNELIQNNLDINLVAAWQDFEESAQEFHQDYGLVSWWGVNKPAFNTLLMSNAFKGGFCKATRSNPIILNSSVKDDTLFIMLANYCPPAILQAINHTLYEGKFTLNQLDSAGYVDISGGDLSYLESIYIGSTTIPSTDPLSTAINASISVYDYYESIETTPHDIFLALPNFTSNYDANQIILNEEKNNQKFRFDSLISAGYSRTSAAAYIHDGSQVLVNETIVITGGTYSFTMQPNEVRLIKVRIDGVGGLGDFEKSYRGIIYPNPGSKQMFFNSNETPNSVTIYNLQGQIVTNLNVTDNYFDISTLQNGIYLVFDSEKQILIDKIVVE